jgi:hypothetical protein
MSGYRLLPELVGAPRRWDADLDGCPRCGAHRWQLVIEVPVTNRVVCMECNAAYERHELVSIGRD